MLVTWVAMPAIGDTGWADYTVRVDAMLDQPGYVELFGRVGAQGGTPAQLDAFVLRVTDGGEWSILRPKAPTTPLATGTVPATFTVNSFHKQIRIVATSVVETDRPSKPPERFADVWPVKNADYDYTVYDYLQFGGPIVESPKLQ